MHLAPDGSVVYHAAGAGVVFNPLTKTQSFYLEHNDDIVCLTLCRNPKLGHVVATGRNSQRGTDTVGHVVATGQRV